MSKTIRSILEKAVLDNEYCNASASVIVDEAEKDISELIDGVIGENEGIYLWRVSMKEKKTLENRDRKVRDKLRAEQRNRKKELLK